VSFLLRTVCLECRIELPAAHFDRVKDFNSLVCLIRDDFADPKRLARVSMLARFADAMGFSVKSLL